jgi:hypothetical protein
VQKGKGMDESTLRLLEYALSMGGALAIVFAIIWIHLGLTRDEKTTPHYPKPHDPGQDFPD